MHRRPEEASTAAYFSKNASARLPVEREQQPAKNVARKQYPQHQQNLDKNAQPSAALTDLHKQGHRRLHRHVGHPDILVDDSHPLREPLHKSGRIKLGFKMIKIKARNASNSPAIACVSQRRG